MSIDRTALPPGVITGQAWGQHTADSADNPALTDASRDILKRIRAGSVSRELERRLPTEEIEWLRKAGLTALRVPRSFGGQGLSLPAFFAFLIELSEADSNITQALRAHYGFIEHIFVRSPDSQERWFSRLLKGDIVGGAWSETGSTAKQAQFSTTLTQDATGWRLNGTKFYTTGSLYADWIQVGATGANDAAISVTVDRRALGVDVIDDWDGMGQRLTASGTTRFTDVPVEDAEVVAEAAPFAYSEAFYQLVHLATLAGIGRAAATDVAAAVAARQRSYSHANAALPADDAQLLQVVGRLRSHAYAAGAIVAQAASALERAANAANAGDRPDAIAVIAEAELEIWQAQTVVSQLILDSTAEAFDALGASATLRTTGLDRYWRNARTIASHNPRIYKDRIVGDFAVNARLPAGQWRIGTA